MIYMPTEIIYIKKRLLLLPMRQLSTKDQMTQKLTTIGHCTAFYNEQILSHIVSYKSHLTRNQCSY